MVPENEIAETALKNLEAHTGIVGQWHEEALLADPAIVLALFPLMTTDGRFT